MKNRALLIGLLTSCLLGFGLEERAQAATHLNFARQSSSAPTMARAGTQQHATEITVANNSNKPITIKEADGWLVGIIPAGETYLLYSDKKYDSFGFIFEVDGTEFLHDFIPNHAYVEIHNLSSPQKIGDKEVTVEAIIKERSDS